MIGAPVLNVHELNLQQHYPSLDKDLLRKIVEVGEFRTFRQGEMIMRSGQYIRSVMLIIDGLVKVFREDNEGNEFFMYYLESGDACALTMICTGRQNISELAARAVKDTTIVAIPLLYMDQWMRENKSWYQFVLGSFKDRFEELMQTIDQIAFRNMDERLVFYLRRYQEKLKTKRIHLTHTEIAQELNSSREVISRLLKKLADKGMLRLHRQYIEVIDLSLD